MSKWKVIRVDPDSTETVINDGPWSIDEAEALTHLLQLRWDTDIQIQLVEGDITQSEWDDLRITKYKVKKI